MRYELLLVPLGVYIPANVTVRREQTSLDCPPVTSVDIKTLCYYRVQFKKKFKPSPPPFSLIGHQTQLKCFQGLTRGDINDSQDIHTSHTY